MYIETANLTHCKMTPERRREMKSADGSEWIIDSTTLETLDNNPQELIQCTESGDRVVFYLTGVHKFKYTLVVSHNLEFSSKYRAPNDSQKVARSAAIFTCPDDGPFLTIRYV